MESTHSERHNRLRHERTHLCAVCSLLHRVRVPAPSGRRTDAVAGGADDALVELHGFGVAGEEALQVDAQLPHVVLATLRHVTSAQEEYRSHIATRGHGGQFTFTQASRARTFFLVPSKSNMLGRSTPSSPAWS